MSILATVDLILLLTCQAGFNLRPLFFYKGSEEMAAKFRKVHLSYSSYLMVLSNVLQLSNIWNTGENEVEGNGERERDLMFWC